MRILMTILFVLVINVTWASAQTTLTAGKLTATFTPKEGLTKVTLDGRTVMTGSSTHCVGSLFTLLRNTPTRDWNWPKNRDTPHYAPQIGSLVDKIGSWQKPTIKVTQSAPDRFTVEHQFKNDVTVTFDHQLVSPDIVLTITIDNQSPDTFQLDDWLLYFLKPQGPARITNRMGSYYPAGDVYSPVTTISDQQWGVGFNWIKHDLRPIEIKLNPRASAQDYQLECWLKNSPIPSGSSRSYTMVLRIDSTPGDWKHLLTPYHDWFAQYFGPARYSMDFRVKTGVFCASVENVSPGNPMGFYGQMDRQGWLGFLNQRIGHLRNYNTGEVIIWAGTGINTRGVNYRPDFDVFPQVLEQTANQLAPYFASLGNKRFGFFARPNTIAYQKSLTEDDDVSFNPLDPRHVRVADKRYEKLCDIGATAFYMDTYGADWGCFPDSAKASVFYLKHLRDKLGPDTLLVTEFGFDAFSVYAAIWPVLRDDDGHKPYGDYAQWLVPGSVDYCRVHNLNGAKRVWEQGGVPMINDYMINNPLMQVQSQFVNPDGSSKVRTDCLTPKSVTPAPATSPLLPVTPQTKTGPDIKPSPVESLFRKK